MSTITSIQNEPTTSTLLRYWYGALTCGHKLMSDRPWGEPTFHAGDLVDCPTCAHLASEVERLKALDEPVFHSRYSERWGGQYHLYRRDQSSPTGVMLITSFPATPEIDAVLRAKRISPLSPTEGR